MAPASAPDEVVIPSALGSASSMHNLTNQMAVDTYRDMDPAPAPAVAVGPSVPPISDPILNAILPRLDSIMGMVARITDQNQHLAD